MDSLSAEAWIAKAAVPFTRQQMGLISGAEADSLGRPALDRAAELDPTHSRIEAEMAGFLTWFEWNWAEAEKAFARVVEADPTNAQIRAGYSHLLLYLNKDDQALAQVEQAATLDPFSSVTQAFYAMTLNFLHRYQEAEAVLLPVLERDPEAPLALSTLRTTYHLMGRHEDAVRMFRASYENLGDLEAVAALSQGYEEGGYEHALMAVAGLFERRIESSEVYVTPWQIATLYARAGAYDRVVPFLEKALEAHDQNTPYISIDPIFDPLRQDPGFRALLARLGLPE
jgi:tetratricopeptide (TPR) repeat protein